MVGAAGTSAALLRSADGYRAAQRGLPDRVAGAAAGVDRRHCGWAGRPSLQSRSSWAVVHLCGLNTGAWRRLGSDGGACG